MKHWWIEIGDKDGTLVETCKRQVWNRVEKSRRYGWNSGIKEKEHCWKGVGDEDGALSEMSRNVNGTLVKRSKR
jgi:hypothetical protein